MRNNLVNAICEEAENNKNIILMTGDLGYNVLNKFYDRFPNQYINAGISEQNMTSVAAGLALSGKIVFTYSIGNFSTLRCFEQIRNDICYHNANVKIVSLAAGFAYGALGMSHHATEDIACMKALPNMIVFSPCDPLETIAVTKKAIELNAPCYIRLGRGGEPNIHKEFNAKDFVVGKAYELHHGNRNVCVFSTGAITIEAKKAVDELKEKGIEISLYSFPTIKPIDVDLIKSMALTHDLIITLEENNIFAGFGSSVADVLSTIVEKHATIKKIGLNDEYPSVVGDTEYLRKHYHMDSEAIKSAILESIK